ncbi:MAG: hypothetical protein JSU68_00880 [Phycisphaerales bacterium]|nr:MAG: hypothetical protein JSU68_00880 [Phycisphaerales bacterium]
MWTKAKLVATTFLLTVLIWVFADQSDRREATLTVQLRLIPDPGSDLVASFVSPESGRATVLFRGTNKVIEKLTSGSADAPLQVDWPIHADSPLGPSTYPLQRVVSDSPRFAGVVVADTFPKQASILVDRFVKQELPVRVQEGAYAFAGEPQIDPPSVTVRIRESAWRQVPVEARQLQLGLENYLRRQPEGRLLTFEVAPPTQLAGHAIEVTPAAVTVSLTLKERTSERRIAPVVVKFAVASELGGGYRIELRDPSMERLEIAVVGSEDALAQLAAKDVLGIIDVTSDDVAPEGEFRFKRPVFILPPGIRLKGEAPQVEFMLRPIGS